ncbi:hypothetical protein ES703_54491 [subsurface metagenome]
MINTSFSLFGHFWYSQKQKELGYRMGDNWENYCKINGEIHHYSEWKDSIPLRNPSNWEDAIYLGWGFFYKHVE